MLHATPLIRRLTISLLVVVTLLAAFGSSPARAARRPKPNPPVFVSPALTALGSPAAVSRDADTVDVFVRASNDVPYTSSWTASTGGSPWTSIGGAITSNPVVARPNPGFALVAARGTDDQLYVQLRMADAAVLPWTHTGTPLAFQGDPAITAYPFGFAVAVRDPANTIHTAAAYGPGDPATWQPVASGATSDPAIVLSVGERYVAFRNHAGLAEVRKADGTLVYTSVDQVLANTKPSLVPSAAGFELVFAPDPAMQAVDVSFDTSTGSATVTAVRSVSTPSGRFVKAAVVTAESTAGAGAISVLLDGGEPATGLLGGPSPFLAALGGRTEGAPALVADRNGHLDTVVVGLDGRLYLQSTAASPGVWVGLPPLPDAPAVSGS